MFRSIPTGARLDVSVRADDKYIVQDLVVNRDRLLPIGHVRVKLRDASMITFEIKVRRAGEGKNAVNINFAAGFQAQEVKNPTEANSVLNHQKGRNWVRKVLGIS